MLTEERLVELEGISDPRVALAAVLELAAEYRALRNRLRGGVLRYPPGATMYSDPPAREVKEKDNLELARETVELFRRGSVLALPTTRDPVTGGYLWDWIPNDVAGDAAIRCEPRV